MRVSSNKLLQKYNHPPSHDVVTLLSAQNLSTLYIHCYTDSLPWTNSFPLGVTQERFLKKKNYGAKFEGCSD